MICNHLLLGFIPRYSSLRISVARKAIPIQFNSVTGTVGSDRVTFTNRQRVAEKSLEAETVGFQESWLDGYGTLF